MAPSKLPTLEEFYAAAERVGGQITKTPMLESHWLTELTGSPVFFKCENLQRTGAYKVRGAYNLMSQLSSEEKKRGVVAASAGNHAQGVALAAKLLGIKATIFMPVGASLPKYQATVDYGANVVLTGAIFDETLAAAQDFTEQTGAVFIPPFDHIDIVRGKGTVGLEIMEQMPDVQRAEHAPLRRGHAVRQDVEHDRLIRGRRLPQRASPRRDRHAVEMRQEIQIRPGDDANGPAAVVWRG